MTVDRYTRVVLTVIAAATVMIAVHVSAPASRFIETLRPQPAEAQATAAKFEVSVPKSWGKLVAFSNNNLLLEAPDGSLRVVDVEGKAPEYPRVKVLIHWQ